MFINCDDSEFFEIYVDSNVKCVKCNVDEKSVVEVEDKDIEWEDSVGMGSNESNVDIKESNVGEKVFYLKIK